MAKEPEEAAVVWRAAEATDAYTRAVWRALEGIYGLERAAGYLVRYGAPTEGEVRMFEETLGAKVLLRPDLTYEVRYL